MLQNHARIEIPAQKGRFSMNFTMVAGLIFVVALILVVIVAVGERRNGHARDD